MIIRILILTLAINEHGITNLAFGSDMYLIQNVFPEDGKFGPKHVESLYIYLLIYLFVTQYIWLLCITTEK
jgi:hypothetical protein